MQLSLWHPKTCTHRVYGMTCEQFEDLRRRAGDLCEMCGVDYHPLVIDHDHTVNTGFPPEVLLTTGRDGVRGLICPKCNSHMRFIDNGERPMDERTQRYLDRAWHLTNVPKYVLPTPDPEPPLRTVVGGPRGRQWRRRHDGWLVIAWPRDRARGRDVVSWLRLSYEYGPESLHIVKRNR